MFLRLGFKKKPFKPVPLKSLPVQFFHLYSPLCLLVRLIFAAWTNKAAFCVETESTSLLLCYLSLPSFKWRLLFFCWSQEINNNMLRVDQILDQWTTIKSEKNWFAARPTQTRSPIGQVYSLCANKGKSTSVNFTLVTSSAVLRNSSV
jgi:hypothetical protein